MVGLRTREKLGRTFSEFQYVRTRNEERLVSIAVTLQFFQKCSLLRLPFFYQTVVLISGNSPLEPIVLQYQGSEWIVARMGTSSNGLGALPYESGEDSEGELMIVPKNHIIFDL